MELFVQKIQDSVVQIVLFALIPFVWWAITARKKAGFFEWIGLKRVSGGKQTALWIAGITVAFSLVMVFALIAVKDVETAASEFTGMGIKALPAVLVYAVLNTSLPEELLFRGFLLKRLSHQFGFFIGNAVQSLLFGLLHGAMFLPLTDVPRAILIIGLTGGAAWCMGYVNERKSDGSVLPSWCIHAASNILSGICSAFSLI